MTNKYIIYIYIYKMFFKMINILFYFDLINKYISKMSLKLYIIFFVMLI